MDTGFGSGRTASAAENRSSSSSSTAMNRPRKNTSAGGPTLPPITRFAIGDAFERNYARMFGNGADIDHAEQEWPSLVSIMGRGFSSSYIPKPESGGALAARRAQQEQKGDLKSEGVVDKGRTAGKNSTAVLMQRLASLGALGSADEDNLVLTHDASPFALQTHERTLLHDRWTALHGRLEQKLISSSSKLNRGSRTSAPSSTERTSSPNMETLTTRWWRIIRSMYSEPHRGYHSLRHLYNLFVMFDRQVKAHSLSVDDPNAVELAIFFHDIVYDPSAPYEENERLSAVVFLEYVESLKSVFLNQEDTTSSTTTILPLDADKVSRWIHATINHRPEKWGLDTDEESATDRDGLLFLDLDLSILATTSFKEYVFYLQGVQQEYCSEEGAFMWGPDFATGRRNFLLGKIQSLTTSSSSSSDTSADASTTKLYQLTPHAKWQQMAVRNMEWEVKQIDEWLALRESPKWFVHRHLSLAGHRARKDSIKGGSSRTYAIAKQLAFNSDAVLLCGTALAGLLGAYLLLRGHAGRRW